MKLLCSSLAFLSLAALFSLPLNAMHTENQALLDAILKHNTEQVRCLLASDTIDVNYQGTDCGASLHASITPIRSALHLAVCLRHADLVKLLLQAGAHPNTRDQDNQTPLHVACYSPTSPEIFSLLVATGADSNAQDKFKRTPLHIAVGERNYKAAQLLLTMPGIDSTLKNHQGYTALNSAQNYFVPSDQSAQFIANQLGYDNWRELQEICQKEKQRIINLLTVGTTSLKKTLINYIKTHPNQFSDEQLAQLPADIELSQNS